MNQVNYFLKSGARAGFPGRSWFPPADSDSRYRSRERVNFFTDLQNFYHLLKVLHIPGLPLRCGGNCYIL